MQEKFISLEARQFHFSSFNCYMFGDNPTEVLFGGMQMFNKDYFGFFWWNDIKILKSFDIQLKGGRAFRFR